MTAASDFRALRRALSEAGQNLALAESKGMDAGLARDTLSRMREAVALAADLEASGAMARAEAAATKALEAQRARTPRIDGRKASRETLRAALGEIAPLPVLTGGDDRAISRTVLLTGWTTAFHFDELRGPRRDADLALARHIAMALCAALTDASYERIGAFLGGRDRTTVSHGIARALERIETCGVTAVTVAMVLGALADPRIGKERAA